ncbi:MAG TPA: AraC family transcriptional regulator [Vicinamibacterales bacterium]|nr:AraC family transcriptional regulator [Vicinamibacterales bacterium]
MQRVSAGVRSDDLSAVLQSIRFQTAIYCRSELSAPWGFSVLGRDFATFHLITHGRCCLEVDGLARRAWLTEGDLIILPTGRAHVVRDAPSSPVTHLEDLIATAPRDTGGVLRSGGGGVSTALVCGGFQFEDRANPVLASLPPLIHLRSHRRSAYGWLNLALEFLGEEAESQRPGAETMMVRLADLLFIDAVRAYVSARGSTKSGLAAALRDPRIATAVVAIHRQPDVKWDIRRLAKQAAMSRAAFADRFKALVGESPISYLTRCRMNKATGLLASSHVPLAQIAARVGYESEASFARAFKRDIGMSPAAYRRKRMASD